MISAPGTETTCDDLDNDCDGETDDDFYLELWDGAWVVGPGQPCGTGACAGGQSACNALGDGLVCSTADLASAEVCDGEGEGIDEDCDGLTDDADPDCEDADGDGVLADGDASGTTGDAPCMSGATTGCDDNCPDDFNPDQADADGDGLGDVCDTDVDGDGHDAEAAGGADCDDFNAGVHPGAQDLVAGLCAQRAGEEAWASEMVAQGGYQMNPAVLVDPLGGLHVTHFEGSNRFFTYSTNHTTTGDPGAWTASVLGSGQWVGRFSGVRMDANRRLHLAYIDSHAGTVRYAVEQPAGAGAFVHETVDEGVQSDFGQHIGFALDDGLGAHVCYQDMVELDLRYASNRSGAWVVEVVDSAGDVGSGCDLALYGDGFVFISYRDGSAGDLKLAVKTLDGAWWPQVIDAQGVTAAATGIDVDAGANAHISYGSEDGLTYATGESLGAWSRVELGGSCAAPDETDLTLDADGAVHVAARDGFVCYHTNASGAWAGESLTSGALTGPSIGVNAAGDVAIAFSHDYPHGYREDILVYTHRACDAWATDADTNCDGADGVDGDGDGVASPESGGHDNCAEVANADQADGDGDGLGDACDASYDAVSPGFAAIPPGSFWMGSPGGETCPDSYTGGGCPDSGAAAEEVGRFADKETLHRVTLTRGFEIMTEEVTQDDWAVVFPLFTPSANTACGGGCPVEQVSWLDALSFANARSEGSGLEPCYTLTDVVCEDGSGPFADPMECMTDARGGVDQAVVSASGEGEGVEAPYTCDGYRLPTEAEWEYAARASSVTAFYPSEGHDGSISQQSCGHEPALAAIGWYCGNAVGASHATGATGGKAPNAWGLYDMAGNVFEWCADGWIEDWGAGARTDPYATITEGGVRMHRGGGWSFNVRLTRHASRLGSGDGDRGDKIGLRLARTLPTAGDWDGDGAQGAADNCVGVTNPGQEDLDGDGQGDACDPDDDDDGWPDGLDCAPEDDSLHPGAEDVVCDGVDDDCDGVTDGGYVATDTSCGVGACGATGQVVCQGGGEVDTCTPNVAAVGDEVCNGADDDCDGFTDAADSDDIGAFGAFENDRPLCAEQRGVCQGAAKPASLCVAGDWTGCGDAQYLTHSEDYEAGSEVSCDGLDNDCDGGTDEGFDDTDGDGEPDCVDTDDDGDGVADGPDNCPLVVNPYQGDADEDGTGDACDDTICDDGNQEEWDGCHDPSPSYSRARTSSLPSEKYVITKRPFVSAAMRGTPWAAVVYWLTMNALPSMAPALVKRWP